VIGPDGSVSIVDPSSGRTAASNDIDGHTKTNALLVHRSDAAEADRTIDMSDEPGHQELCDREQAVLLDAIREDRDMSGHLADAVNSLRIVLAADESVRTGRVVHLAE